MQRKALRPFNNYVMLPSFEPPIPYHHASSRMITRPTIHCVTPDIDTPPPLYHLFLFLEVEKENKDMHPPMTHPPMFLSN